MAMLREPPTAWSGLGPRAASATRIGATACQRLVGRRDVKLR